MKMRKVIEEGFADCGSSEEFEYAPWEGSGPGNKEGRSRERQCVFSNQTCKVTAVLYHSTPHVVYDVVVDYCAAMYV